MPGFTRTIPAYKTEQDLQEIFSNPDRYLPLSFRPGRASAGDRIHLIHHDRIIARAEIAAIEPAGTAAVSEPPPDWARWIVRWTGSWEKPARELPARGHQGVRYLEAQVIDLLEAESWEPIGTEKK